MDTFLVEIEKYKDEFYRYIHRNVWDSGVAEDVFSQGVLTAYENRHKFKEGTNFRAWMYRILTNKCFVANRETGRAFDPLERAENVAFANMDERPDYKEVLKNPDTFLEQCGDEVYRSFRRLSTAERSCLLLRVVERFSYQEIAEILEMPVGTVMTHLSRGRAKLRTELADYAQETGIIRNYPKLLDRRRKRSGPASAAEGSSSPS
jgi:RNA polymerase sigma-70 factor, ECF subfamily